MKFLPSRGFPTGGLFGAVAAILLLVSSGFRIVGAFGWVMDHVIDFPFVTLLLSLVVAAVPGFGLYASYSTMADSKVGPLWSGILLAPSVLGDVMMAVGLFGMLAAAVSRK